MTTANVVFATDSGYVPHLAAALHSLVANHADWDIEISILNADIDPANWRKLESLVDARHHRLLDVKIAASLVEGLPLGHHFTPANYYRLFIPELVASDRALYLDADVIVRGNLESFYRTALNGCLLAAVENPGFDRHEELEMDPSSKAFNSGVMLLNLEAWREINLKDRVLQFVRGKPHVIQFVDQCGLNSVVDGHWRPVHPRFNMQSSFFDLEDTEADAIFEAGAVRMAIGDPVVIHYTGTPKPWHLNSSHPYKSLYWRHRKATPFRRLTPDDISVRTLARRAVPERVRRFVQRMIRKD